MRQETNPMCEQLDFLDLEDLIQLQDFNDTESTPTLPNQVNFLQLNQHKSEIVDQLTKNFVLSFNKRNWCKHSFGLYPSRALLLQIWKSVRPRLHIWVYILQTAWEKS